MVRHEQEATPTVREAAEIYLREHVRAKRKKKYDGVLRLASSQVDRRCVRSYRGRPGVSGAALAAPTQRELSANVVTTGLLLTTGEHQPPSLEPGALSVSPSGT